MKYKIRQVQENDLEQAAGVEASCFPPEEAGTFEAFSERIKTFPEGFFVAEGQGSQLIGLIDGCASDRKRIVDEMFEDCGYHKADGAYQSIFGLSVIPEWRHKGVASALMKHMIEDARSRGRKGLILTCKEGLIPFYKSLGYESLGVSASVHGGAVWYDMILEF